MWGWIIATKISMKVHLMVIFSVYSVIIWNYETKRFKFILT